MFKNLKELDLSYNLIVNPTIMKQIVSVLGSQLEKLGLAGCIQIRDNVMSGVAAKCPNLRHLDISRTGVSFNTMRQLQAQNWIPKLHTLFASHISLLGYPSVLQKGFQGFPSLSVLILQNSIVTPTVITFMISKSPNLAILNLAKSRYDGSLLFSKHIFPQLFALSLARTPTKCFEHLNRSCPNVEDLDLSGTPISEEDLCTIVTTCTHLHTLQLAGCRAIDRDLRSLDKLKKKFNIQ